MSLTPAEQKVRKLARLPANAVCANCGTHKKFGFSTVCIKFHTFVCNNCKSSHQAISHRCKSLTMSSWSDEEVSELERKGNDYARRTWLKHAPPVGQGGRPKEGDDVNVFKRFVVTAYEHKKYYGPDDGPPVQSPSPSELAAAGISMGVPVQPSSSATLRAPPKPAVAAVPPPAAPRARPMPPSRPPVKAAPPVAAPVADLLDFSSPAPAPSSTSSQPNAAAFQPNFDVFATNSSAPSAPATPSTNMFDPNYTAASTATTSSPSVKLAPPPMASSAPSTTAATAPASTTGSAFSFITSPPAPPVPTPATTNGTTDPFADFSGLPSQPQTSVAEQPSKAAEQPKKQVMSNMSLNTKSNIISMMDMPPTKQKGVPNGRGGYTHSTGRQQQQQQRQQPNMMMMQQQQPMAMMGNNNMMGMGMQGMMNPQQQQQMMMMSMQQQMGQMNLGGGGGSGMYGNMNNMQPMGMGVGAMNPNMMMMMNNGGMMNNSNASAMYSNGSKNSNGDPFSNLMGGGMMK